MYWYPNLKYSKEEEWGGGGGETERGGGERGSGALVFNYKQIWLPYNIPGICTGTWP